ENRMIDVRWAEKSKTSYLAEIVVKASDRPALLLDVANVIADENINMKAMNARKTKDAYAVLDLTIEITERNELDRLIKRLKRIESVIDVSRTIR
ncbi:MAG: bifunctional (p)ppGpp synthetase/guanosine-3',5'-bis(diphosphate) 3'-pyrophosphohydrolase, partial [Clostridia bacterium]|nr:bifunctional (p)ppGpp synthetase/guanosine-3',5'-bis(diphosphate) 3'-pyrophosphohydrolase [Clostridia bacterium]